MIVLGRLLVVLALLWGSPAWANFFLGGGHGSGVPIPPTQSVATNGITLDGSPTTDSFVCGSGDETTVSAIQVALSPASPLFAGTLSLGGADAQFYELDSPTLPANLLTVGAPPCRTNNITLTATAAPGQPLANGPFTQAFTITAIQQSITAITLSGTSFTAGAASGTTVGWLGVSLNPAPPPNPMGTVYALASGISGCTGTDNASFTVGSDGVSLQTVGVLSGASYAVCVSANNSLFTTSTCSVLSGSTCYMSFTITTTGQTIVSTSISAMTFPAGGSSGTTVGQLSTTMGPPTPAFAGSYALVSSGGTCSGGDTTHFAISSSNLNLTSTATTATTYIVCVRTSQSGLTTIYTALTLTGASSSLPAVCTAGQPCVANTRIYSSGSCTTGGTPTPLGLSTCQGVWTNTNFTTGTVGSFNYFSYQPIRAAELNSVEPGDTLDVWPATYDEGDTPLILNHTIQCIGTYPSINGPGSCILNPSQLFYDGNGLISFTTAADTPIHSTALQIPATQTAAIYAGGCATVAQGGQQVFGTGIASPTYVAPNAQTTNTLAISAQTTADIPLGSTIQIRGGCRGDVTYGGFRLGPIGGMYPKVTIVGFQIQDVTNQWIPPTFVQPYTTTTDTPPGSTSITFGSAAMLAGNGRKDSSGNPDGTLTGYQFANGGDTFTGQPAIVPGTIIPSGGVTYGSGSGNGSITLSAATAQVLETVGGAPASGDVATITINGNVVSTTLTSASTTTSTATALAAGVNANSSITGAGISATSSAAIVQLSWSTGSPTVTQSATGALTIAQSSGDIPSGTAISIVAAHGSGACDGSIGIQELAPTVCGGDAVAGIRYQGGEITCNNCGFFHVTNSVVGNPFVEETGLEKCNNCFSQYGGGGQGQSHVWYCGQTYECDLLNSILLDANAGEDYKCRAQVCTITNDVLGDSDACGLNNPIYTSTWVPQTDGVGGWPGGNGNKGTSNEVNGTQGGTFTLTNNIMCKSGTFSTNVNFVEFAAGQVAPWANSSWTETGTKVYSTCGGTGQCFSYMWPGLLANASTSSISITGLEFFAPASGNIPENGILGPYGTMTATQSINGGGATTYTPTLTCTYVPMVQTPKCNITTWDHRTATTNVVESTNFNQSTTDETILGPNNGTCPACTLTVTGLSDITAIAGGSGGTTVNVNTAYQFYDQAGYTASNIAVLANGSFNADGDVITPYKNGSLNSYTMLTGRNLTFNGCTGTVSAFSNCGGIIEWVPSNGYLPSGSAIGNYTATNNDPGFACSAGCTISLTGNWASQMNFWGAPSSITPTSVGPATVNANYTIYGPAVYPMAFGFQGCAASPDNRGRIFDYSDKNCRDFIYLSSVPGGIPNIHNTTLDFGTSTGVIVSSLIDATIGAQVYPAVVVGSGTGQITLNPTSSPLYPTTTYELLQVAPTSMTGINGGFSAPVMSAHHAGGSLTVTNYTAGNAANAPVIALGPMTLSCSGTTISATDGIAADNSTIVLQNLASCPENTTPPSGSQDGTLTPPSSPSGTHGTTISIPVTLSDAWWQTLNSTLDQGPGEGWARVCSSGSSLIFNGNSSPISGNTTLPSSFCQSGYTGITMASTPAAMVTALAGLQITLGAAGTYTVVVDTWNGAGQHLTSTFSVVSH